jgi:hypothetical protein
MTEDGEVVTHDVDWLKTRDRDCAGASEGVPGIVQLRWLSVRDNSQPAFAHKMKGFLCS